jgi:hypothetical protein
MPERVTDIIIDASVDKVWRILADFPAYSEWNPYIRRVTGSLKTGVSLHVTRLLPGRGEVASTPTVTLYRPGREIRLLDRPVLPGLLDVEHGLKLEPLGPEQVRFVHWQTTSGLLAPIFGGGSDDGLQGQLEAMNVALKGVVERGLPVSAPSASPAKMAKGSRFAEQRPEMRRTA